RRGLRASAADGAIGDRRPCGVPPRRWRAVQRHDAVAEGNDAHLRAQSRGRLSPARRVAQRLLGPAVLPHRGYRRAEDRSTDGDARDDLVVGHQARRLVGMETVMLDVLYVVITLVFFVLAVAYVVACERLE